ncbi:relaxin 3 [Rhinolophus ferrumequinum]|uniref:Relaxin 3 n=1 Tax=Rhinolophus ferrumequinum TaxID=59479 RepID=A0A7J7VS97_RHIFE|nr:relaxin 3 [Rhinolophus ferrumequinum]
MPRLFVSYLLGLCLLLSQLPAEIQGRRNQKKNEFIKLCGSELALYYTRLCDSLNWDRMALSPKEPRLRSGPLADIMSLTDAKDAETLSMLESGPASSEERKTALSERQPSLRERQAALQDGNLKAEDFKDNILTRQNEADDSSELEFKNTGSAKHYPQKRSAGTPIVDRCCNYGCYIKELARYC